MQLAVTTLDGSITFSHQEPLSEADAVDAASWVTPRLGGSKELDFFKSDGRYHHLLHKLVEAVTEVLKYLFVQRLEVPFIYAHRRDYITYYDLKQPRASRVELLGRNDLWRIYELGQKYQSLRQRLQGLQETYKHLNVQDEYYEQHLKGNIDSVDVVSDITQWLALKHKGQKKGANDLNFEFHDDHEEDDQQGDGKKLKLPSRGSRYELTKRSIVSKLAEVHFFECLLIALLMQKYRDTGSNPMRLLSTSCHILVIASISSKTKTFLHLLTRNSLQTPILRKRFLQKSCFVKLASSSRLS